MKEMEAKTENRYEYRKLQEKTVMALDRAIRNQGSEGSVYDGRGILVF